MGPRRRPRPRLRARSSDPADLQFRLRGGPHRPAPSRVGTTLRRRVAFSEPRRPDPPEHTGLPGHVARRAVARICARPRRPAGPADPALAVRLGGGRRPRRLVRGARDAVAEAAPGDGDGAQALLGAGAAIRGRSAALIGVGVFAVVVYAGFAGAQTETANLAHDDDLRGLLDRPPDPEPVLR